MHPTTRRRFSKSALLDLLEARKAMLEAEWAFNSNNGRAQVRNSSDERKIAYGAYETILDLIDDLREWSI